MDDLQPRALGLVGEPRAARRAHERDARIPRCVHHQEHVSQARSRRPRGEASWIAGDFAQYVGNGFWGGIYASFLDDFRATGRLPSLDPQETPAALLQLTDDQITALSLADKQSLAKQLRGYASFAALYQRFQRVEGAAIDSDAALGRYLMRARRWLDSLAGRDRKQARWGDAALSATAELAPGEEREIRFTLGWYFPHHLSPSGADLGHAYEAWFKDAGDVNRFLVANYARHREATLGFAGALAGTTLGAELGEAWSAQLSTLVKCTWWNRNGEFAVWEGLGCCGFQTMDVSYQGSGSIIALFPELQQRQMEMSARFQRADGRVPHFFTPDLSRVDNSFDRVDMNPQFVLMVCRDWLWRGDRGYLETMWPHVQRAIANTALLDTDGDGLPDKDTTLNTYDNWDFFGTPAYIASLWLASLKAGVHLAEAMHNTAVAATAWGELRQGARRLTLACRTGTITFQRLRVNLAGHAFSARVGGRSARCTVAEENGYRVLDFGSPLTLGAGQSLVVSA